jgi:poly(3-hydroxybutyrate) depolymerase
MAAPSSVSSMPPPARVPTVTGRASTGCGLELGAPQATIRVNGLSMRYVLDLPATYDKTQPYPLLMAFHGENVTAEVFRSQLGLTALAGSEAVVVHPEVPSDAVSWDPQRDIPLVDALRADLAARYCVDEDRVFAVGHGSGAWLVTMFGCMHGDELRGIALLSGAPPPGMCLGQPAAWLAQNASDAMTLGFGRGNRDFWGSRNGCDMGMAAPVAPSPCLAYGGCDVRSPVQYCEYSRSADPPSFAASSMWGYFRGLQP